MKDELLKLKELYEQNLITDDEYARAKNNLLFTDREEGSYSSKKEVKKTYTVEKIQWHKDLYVVIAAFGALLLLGWAVYDIIYLQAANNGAGNFVVYILVCYFWYKVFTDEYEAGRTVTPNLLWPKYPTRTFLNRIKVMWKWVLLAEAISILFSIIFYLLINRFVQN